MSADKGDADERRERLEEGVEKAKEGAKKLKGWLGNRLEKAAEHVKSVDVVREQLDRYDRFKDEQQQEKRQASITDVYDEWMEKLARAVEGIKENIAALEKGAEEVQYNINELRLRGVAEDDSEMREYHDHIRRMRTEIRELDASAHPFHAELERVSRQRRAATARLQSEPRLLGELQAEARQHIVESRERLNEVHQQTDAEAAQQRQTNQDSESR